MSPLGSARLPRRAAAVSRFACRAARRRDGSMNRSQLRPSHRVFHGPASIGSGATSGSFRKTIPTAIIGCTGRVALAGPDSERQYSPDPDRAPVGGSGRRRVRGDIEGVLQRRRACSGPAIVRRDAAWDRRKRTHRFIVPPTAGLQEKRRWAVAAVGADAQPRITLTYPVLESSRDVAFLATGAGKRDVVARARAGDRALPAALVRPIGRLHWFTDRAAVTGET
jgi:hypothetical protein